MAAVPGWNLLIVGILLHGSLRGRVAQAVASTAPQASVQDKDGWVNGRATFSAPSSKYVAQFHGSTFGEASAGSCGYYNGADSANYSAVIIPEIMRAAAVSSNPDFVGSCGRCYEVQCVSGPVIGNYSGNSAVNLPLASANPPYQQQFVNLTSQSQYPLDDKGTIFEGNSGEEQDLLTVQCHERTLDATIIRVIDSCLCTTKGGTEQPRHNGTNPCCTNVPHFNIDYHAFQDLAHPDYGWMNMRFRPVDCITKEPGPRYLPGALSNKIFSDQPETGWGVSTYPNKVADPGANQVYAVDQQLQTTRLDYQLETLNGTCFTFPSGKQYAVGMNLFCEGCDVEGYAPFALANSSGIELFVETAVPQTGNGFVDGSVVGLDQVPRLMLNLGNRSEDGASPCKSSAVSLSNLTTRMDLSPDSANPMYQLRFLWQNTEGFGFFQCVPSLSLLSSINIAPENVIRNISSSLTLSLQVTFCLSNITILPSTLVSEANLIGKPLPPEGLGNCFSSEPQPVNKDGRYVDMGDGFLYAANVSKPTDPNGFAVFKHVDLQNYTDLHTGEGQRCTRPGASYADQVEKCKQSTPSKSQCCVDFKEDQSLQASDVQETLASICNDVVVEGGKVCHAFTWDYMQKRSYFKGQNVNVSTPYNKKDLIANFTMCNNPSVTTWILNAALSGGTMSDTRELTQEVLRANKASSSNSSWTRKVWSAVGAVLGIASPVIAVLVFLVIFNSYRLEKKTLVKQVMKTVQAHDICAPAAATSPTVDPVLLASYSTPHDTEHINPILLASSNSVTNSGQLLLSETPFSGTVPSSESRRRDALGDSAEYDPDGLSTAGEPTAEEVQQVGREITLRCLQRWDGFMGFRASTDSLGRQSGIWREKFDGVRIASMLLAFRRLNASLGYNQPGNTGSLYKTWTQSNFKHQGMLVSGVSRMLQSISVDEAQALPYKDPETIGAHDRLCGYLKACSQCCSRRK